LNLINRKTEKLPLVNFRQYQIDLIPSLIDVSIKYLIANGVKIKPDTTVIKVSESPNNMKYMHSGNYYSNTLYSVTVNEQVKDPFMFLYIPKLTNNMFTLNSSKYIPILYLVDNPITFKKRSIMIYSLFSSLTIEKKARRVIYEGANIPIARFLRIFYDDDEIPGVIPEYESQVINETRDRSLVLLSQIFNTSPDWTALRAKINTLFFDDYTVDLYRKIYKFETRDLKEVLDYVRDNINSTEDDDFINLNYKRVVFIEQLLLPVFKAVQSMIVSTLKNDNLGNIIKLKLNKPGEITNYFFNHMNGSTLYESTNTYASLTLFKATFKKPGSSSNLPSCVSSIHHSYKGIIDPVVVSNEDPGEIVSLVPTTKIDMKHGIIEMP